MTPVAPNDDDDEEQQRTTQNSPQKGKKGGKKRKGKKGKKRKKGKGKKGKKGNKKINKASVPLWHQNSFKIAMSPYHNFEIASSLRTGYCEQCICTSDCEKLFLHAPAKPD
jgi:hypothetical protein